MKKKPLDARQKKYCRERAAGKTQRAAYRAAGYCPNGSDNTVDVAACKLERDERIRAELARLQRLAENGAVLNRQQRISLLSEMALDETRKDDARQRAIDMLNRMGGDYTEHTITEVTAAVDLSLEEKRSAVLQALKGET